MPGLTDEDPEPRIATRLERTAAGTVMVRSAPLADLRTGTQERVDRLGPLLGIESWTEEGHSLVVRRRWIEGTPLSSRLTGGPLPPAEAARVGAEILGDLAGLHAAGALHGGVGPTNVILTERRAVLVDAGLGRSDLRGQPSGDDPGHLAPDQLGLIRDRAEDVRSDLFAVGTLLLVTLGARAALTPGELWDALLAGELVGVAADTPIPDGLRSVLGRLLAKNPDDRYATALGAAVDLGEIARQVAAGDEPFVVLGLTDQRSTLTDPGVVGRRREVERLRSAVERARGGRGGTVLVEGASGAGKTTLAEELLRSVAVTGFERFRVDARWAEPRRPFAHLQGVARALTEPAAADRLARVLGQADGPERPALLAALPALRRAAERMPGIVEAPREDEIQTPGTELGVRVVADLVAALGSPERPAVLVLDDLQWSDAETLATLAELARRDVEHLLIVALARSDELPDDHPVRSIPLIDHLRLAPLADLEIADLAHSMGGSSLPDEAVTLAVTTAHGNPFAAVGALRGAVERGELTAGTEGWRLREGASALPSREAAAHLSRRLDALPEGVLRLLGAGAVLGSSFDVAAALRLARLDPDGERPELALAVERRLLDVDQHAAVARFAHDTIRESVLSTMAPDELRGAHRRVAERAMAAGDDHVDYAAAFHLDAAGEPDQAAPYALRAARRALMAHALDTAHTYLAIASRGEAGLAAADRWAAWHELAMTRMLLGRYAESRVAADRALALATETSAIRTRGLLAQIAFKQGDVATAASVLESGLRSLGEDVPTGAAGYKAALARERRRQAGLPRERPAGAAPAAQPVDPRIEAVVELLSSLCHAYWFGRGPDAVLWVNQRQLNLAERGSPPRQLAQTLAERAVVLTVVPDFEQAVAAGERSLALWRELGDDDPAAPTYEALSLALYSASRFDEAIERADRAIERLARVGDRWKRHSAMWVAAFALLRRGDLREAARRSEELYASAAALGDASGVAMALGAWAKAAPAAAPARLVEEELARPRQDVQARGELLQAAAILALQAGAPSRAVGLLEEADAAIAEAGLRNEFAAAVPAWLTTALRSEAHRLGPLQHARRRALLLQATRTAQRARRLAAAYRNNLPHVLREQALLAAEAGRLPRARTLLLESRTAAEELQMSHEAARATALLAELDGAEGAPSAAARTRVAAQALDQMEVPAPVARAAGQTSLAARLQGVVNAGREIAAARTRDEVLAATVTALPRLVGAQAASCFALDADAAPVGDGALDLRSVGSLVAGARSAGRAQASSPLLDGPGEEMLIVGGIRSALAAPIEAGDVTAFCVVAVHDEVRGLFGPDELRLAEHVCALASAALEHADRLAESWSLAEAVARSEVRYRRIVETANEGVWVVDEHSVTTFVNRRMAEMLGYAPEEMLGRPLRDFLPPEEQLAARGRLDRRREGIGEQAEVRYVGNGGLILYGLMNAAPLHDDDGAYIGALAMVADIGERKRAEEQLRYQADHDALTGIYNRRRLEAEVARLLSLSRRRRTGGALLVLDIDDFKVVNDTNGHTAGDALLRGVAQALLGRLRDVDVVARMGGDEFAVVLFETSVDEAEQIAEALLAEVRGVHVDGIRPTASVGVADFTEGASVDDLLAAADMALYVAKDAGRNCVRRYVDRLGPGYSMVERVRRAVYEEGLVLHSQPIVQVTTGEQVREELLVRMLADDGGILAPAAFLPVAERFGLIRELDRWVLRRGLELAATGRAVALNMSGRSLVGEDWTEEVAALLEHSGADPARVLFEITETAAVANIEDAIVFTRRLSKMGCRIALDDFGTGFGALTYLKRLSVQMIKIDMDFVRKLASDEDNQRIVRGIVAFADGFGIETTAEGVEDAATLELLRRLGVDYAQGFYLGRPAPL